MKRLLSLLLVFAFAFLFLSPVMAETIDLSSFDNDALVELLRQVQQEVVDRKIAKSAVLPVGSYTVGKDIPAGSYDIYVKYTGDYWMDIYIYENAEKASEKKSRENFTVFDDKNNGEGNFHVTLADGEVLRCTDSITLTVYVGIMFN